MSLQYTIRHTWKTIVLLLPFALSCGRGSDPERTLEGYLKAAVSRNTVEVRRLSCGEEVPQLLNWKIIYRVPVVVSSPGFLEEMETVRVTIDTLRSRCDSLKSYLMEDCVDIEEDEFHSFLTELKKVAGAANREQATETAPVRSMAGHLRFLARKNETPGGMSTSTCSRPGNGSMPATRCYSPGTAGASSISTTGRSSISSLFACRNINP